MSRGIRILADNSYYHITNRGNQKQRIFQENADYEEYIGILAHYKRKFGIKLLGYCFMPNHVHLILEPKNPKELAKFMQCVTQGYAKWFNLKYNKVGHLWQGRFKSMVIQKNDYFLDCVYYVEANPVRASLVLSPVDYPWSSYKERVLMSDKKLLDLPDTT
jgi:putative transposase